MKFARDGLREMIGSAVLLLGFAALALFLCSNKIIGAAIACPLVIIWLWVMYFFRDPERNTPTEPGAFISPADGVVSDITPVGADSELGCDGVRIGVFMNVFNVHVNRAPCDAEVVETRHNVGKFMDVRLEDAWRLNESLVMTLKYNDGVTDHNIIVRQVAGLVAKRIVCNVSKGDKLKRGERFGLIKFGSRLELMLPDALAAKACVSIGQKAKAGETILAKHEIAGKDNE